MVMSLRANFVLLHAMTTLLACTCPHSARVTAHSSIEKRDECSESVRRCENANNKPAVHDHGTSNFSLKHLPTRLVEFRRWTDRQYILLANVFKLHGVNCVAAQGPCVKVTWVSSMLRIRALLMAVRKTYRDRYFNTASLPRP